MTEISNFNNSEVDSRNSAMWGAPRWQLFFHLGNPATYPAKTKRSYNVRERCGLIPKFEWDEITQQTILGAFYYGYAVMPILGGWLAGKKGGKRVMVFVVLWTSLLTALIPWAAGVSSGLLIILRILDGLGQGTSLPAIYVILGKWSVPDERTTMVSICFSGTFGLVWVIIWATFIYEKPENDPWISKKESEYLKSFATKDEVTSENRLFPWRDIITSSAVWAITIGYFAYAFAYYVILTEAPTFMYTVLGVDVKRTGFLLSIPNIVRFPIMLLSAVCADYIIHRRCLSVAITRKLFVILNIGVSGVCFIVLAYAGDNIVTFMILVTTAFSALGFNVASVTPNPMDISTNYSGIIVGIMVTFGSCAGFIGPLILALIIENNSALMSYMCQNRIV
ncbi:sialin-like [Anneissia japonica]|uniref:sialin-like n=1 Tax=Anneissia japonica TaxID=1529436 RepID=UPI0014257A23|nr:sialin-like [Anneissia japonica]